MFLSLIFRINSNRFRFGPVYFIVQCSINTVIAVTVQLLHFTRNKNKGNDTNMHGTYRACVFHSYTTLFIQSFLYNHRRRFR